MFYVITFANAVISPKGLNSIRLRNYSGVWTLY